MLLASVNAVFALIFGSFALRASQRGWLFLRGGWRMIQTQAAPTPDDSPHDINEQAASEGGRFFLAGVLWLGSALIAGILTLWFAYQTLIFLVSR